MARSHRSETVEINFDGLTDSVTNLVGALILLVVLIIGVTKAVPSEMGRPDVIVPVEYDDEAEDRTAAELNRRIRELEAGVARLDEEILMFRETRIPALEDSINQLFADLNQEANQ